MPETDLFRIVLSRLEESGLQYMMTGAAAAIVYGQPRLTHDIDLVVEMSEGDAWKVSHVFPEDQFYCPPREILEQEARRALRGHFNVIHHASGFKADFYLKGRDELHRWAMAERRRIDFEGLSIWVAPPEYVILRKLEYYREGGSEKHLRDIAGIMDLSPEQIDMESLRKKIAEYGLEKEWEEVQVPLPS
ncbi:MAG: hypothetical protein CVU57_13430 [Deltaproteobacteria bacterium HGW-Deltaproteobacteria-15]|jgi:hypothetical protein|nr:MAG: hypothetical protein CVU57_13430 [Deltaproteobacteria bacterium HGW-Deltaproteobacteria-15]